MKRFINFLKKQPFLCAVLAVILAMAGIKLLDGTGLFGEAVLRIILAMAMGFFLYLISGEKTLDCCGDSTGYAIKVLAPCLILPAVIGLTGFLGFFTDTPIRSNWPIQLLAGALEMLSVGLFEEVLFRAVINDGIMYQFRNFKGVWILCALVSSLVFGWVHVISADVSQPLLMAQALLKIITCAQFGLCMLFLYWKTRNIWACALVHALFDFMPGWAEYILDVQRETNNTYVAAGESGVFVMVFYLIEAAVLLIAMIQIYRKVVKNIDFEELRKTW